MNKYLLSTFIAIVIIPSGFSALSGQEVEGLVNPKSEQQVITIGGQDADIGGYTSDAIQLGIDALKSRGGGTIKLNPGRYDITGPVRLASNMRLIGSGKQTVLRKCDGFSTRFVVDADWGMLKVSVEDPSGFKTGMGIQLYDDINKNGWDVTTAKILAIDGNILYIDNRTVHDYIASKNGTISNAISLVEAVEAENVLIANLTVDGNGESNEYLNGCRGGGIYIHKSKHCVVENVHVTNYNGDSFSWQITEHITVRNCEASYGKGLGFHPGTGSDRSIIENCRSHHNERDGIFLCWRVQNGIFRDNLSFSNGGYGISIGHQDTDNLFFNNHIYENKGHGVYFRKETEQNSGHRNTFRNNIIENNGESTAEAYGFYIGGVTNDIVIENNILRSTNAGNQVGGVFIGTNTSRITVKNNTISGHPELTRE